MTPDPAIVAIILAVATYHGIPHPLALAMADLESAGTFDPAIQGDGGHSVGLYQLHDRGLGAGLGRLRELPALNADIALSHLAATPRDSLTLGQWAAASQRPYDPALYAREIDARLPRWEAWLAEHAQPSTAPLLTAVAHLADVVATDQAAQIEAAALLIAERARAAQAEAQRIREQFVGPRPPP